MEQLLPSEAQKRNNNGWVLRLIDKEEKKNTPAKLTQGKVKRSYEVIGL